MVASTFTNSHSTVANRSPASHPAISTKTDHRIDNNEGVTAGEAGQLDFPSPASASSSTQQHQAMMMPNSPTSLASQSRRLRLKGSNGSNSMPAEQNDFRGRLNGSNHFNDYNNITTPTKKSKNYISNSSSHHIDSNDHPTQTSSPFSSKVANLKKVFESKSLSSSATTAITSSPRALKVVSPSLSQTNHILEVPSSQPTPERFHNNKIYEEKICDDEDQQSSSLMKKNRFRNSLSPSKKRERNQLKYNKVDNQSHNQINDQKKDQEQPQQQLQSVSSIAKDKKPKKKIIIQVKDGMDLVSSLSARKEKSFQNSIHEKSLPSGKNNRIHRDHDHNDAESTSLDLIADNHINPNRNTPQKLIQEENLPLDHPMDETTSVDTPTSTTSRGLSDRRRKMAKVKKHARLSPSDTNIRMSTTPDISSDSTHSFSNGIAHSSSTQYTSNIRSHQQQHHHQNEQHLPSKYSSSPKKNSTTAVSFQDDQVINSTSNRFNDGSNKGKFPASPSRRRKFELVKESMKQRRNQNQLRPQDHEALFIDSNNASNLKQDVSTTTTTTTTATISSEMSNPTRKHLDRNSHGNTNSTTQTLSTASLSTSTFETFDTDFNSFQQQQQQEFSSPRDAVVEKNDKRYQNKSPTFSSLDQKGSTSGELQWGIDEFVPNQASPRKNNQTKQIGTGINHKMGMNERNHFANQTTQSNFQPFGQGSNEFLNKEQQQHSFHNSFHQEEKTTSTISSQQKESTDFINNDQNPQYFAPPNTNHHTGNTWDDDDETQFNSVAENPDKMKSDRHHHVNTVNLSIHPLQSNPNSTKSKKSAPTSYFSSGFVTKRVLDFPLTGSYTFDNGVGAPTQQGGADDDESYSGRSWTGRMRAKQGVEYNGGGIMPMDKHDSVRYESPSKRSLYSIDDNNTEYSHFSASQLLTRDIGNNAVCSDATNGVEEVKKFAKEDPTTTAVGLGVCGALCGALAFGSAGFVLAVGAVGACYGASQLPQEKRDKMKETASTTIEKIKSQTESASDFMSSNCGCGDSSTGVEKVDGGAFETRSLGVSITPYDDQKGGIVKLTPPSEKVSNQQSPRKIKLNNHHMRQIVPQKTEVNALLVQASKRKLNRMVPACCRMSRITPVYQIQSLDPSLHARAWLDVMASAWTSRDEKNEAMEEILLLSKDKNRARMLLEVCDFYCTCFQQ